jgi:hypothetical protein
MSQRHGVPMAQAMVSGYQYRKERNDQTCIDVVRLLAGAAQAETPQQILEGLVAQAGSGIRRARGEKLFRGKFAGGKTADSVVPPAIPTMPKRLASTSRPTRPSIRWPRSAQKDRFTDPAKVEKWFKRNCNDVLSRACTPQEKADFTAYMISLK